MTKKRKRYLVAGAGCNKAYIAFAERKLHWKGQLDGEFGMLYTIIAVLIVLWLLGFLAHIGGGLIHALLVIALVLFIYNLIVGRRSV